jgi:hypothetical protein
VTRATALLAITLAATPAHGAPFTTSGRTFVEEKQLVNT